jgi:hypothetical protein
MQRLGDSASAANGASPAAAPNVDVANIARSSKAPSLAIMTVVVRRGRVTAEPRHRSIRFDRFAPVGSRSEAARDLARIALDVVVRAIEPASLPRRWSTHAFAREVAAVRAQLAPIRSRRSLAESFGREAAVAATIIPPSVDPAEPPGPVRVASAIRWLELGDDRIRPSWAEWTGQPPAPVPDQRNGEINT